MFVSVIRTDKTHTRTIGRLMVDGQFRCFTLEDADREQKGVPVSEWKIAGKTCIPAGKYPLLINQSNRFKREMPYIFGVPGFEGVRIHAGNTDADTEGCILIGNGIQDDRITHSRDAFNSFFDLLQAAINRGDECEIEII